MPSGADENAGKVSMATNYTGNGSSTQPPGPTPSLVDSPIASIPSDGDALNSASIAQSIKEAMDWSDFLRTSLVTTNSKITAITEGGSLVFYDDFIGEDLDHGLWLGNATSVVAEDYANGAYGAATLSKGTSATALMTTRGMPIASTDDFVMSCRIRCPAIGGSGSFTIFGLVQDPTTQFLGGATSNWLALAYAPSINGNNNWWLWYGSGNVAGVPPTKVDTTVAPGTTTYQNFRLFRILSGATLGVSQDGVTLNSASPSPFSLSGAAPFIVVSRATSGTTTMYADYVKMYAATGR